MLMLLSQTWSKGPRPAMNNLIVESWDNEDKSGMFL